MTDHRVILGDCLDPVSGLASLPDKSVDHVITDPPYDAHTHGAQRRGSTGKDKRNGLGAAISMERHLGFAAITGEDMARVAAEAARICRRWSVIFCAMEQQHAWQTALAAAGLDHVRFAVWRKLGSTPQFTGDRPGSACEAVEIAHPPGRKRWNGGGKAGVYETTVCLEGRNGHTGDRHHPTQKPLDLMEALVRDFTDPDDLILDPFAGSGTTGVACKRLGRRFVGWERDPKYHAIAEKRIAGAREQFGLWTGAA